MSNFTEIEQKFYSPKTSIKQPKEQRRKRYENYNFHT